ncbi:hypothetical protein ZHAS_00005769 [Anopheles sinensis]|uniref:Uncharacterized protein n=1 Tax=Anopheles sinensis TaxID=74873 RepID=A0A084VKB5_ANOSI|nr:hypothetical protein ZHAS_00005769 [Anopheles sinensis]
MTTTMKSQGCKHTRGKKWAIEQHPVDDGLTATGSLHPLSARTGRRRLNPSA